jgi:hypothetical protein
MMLIGTSLGGCLKSLAADEVSLDDVLCIITRTKCKDKESLMHVVEDYHSGGNNFAMISNNYELGQYDLDAVKEIAHWLWESGKIHQPRLYNNIGGFVHPELVRDQLWLEIAPRINDNPAVLNAYNHYKMLRTLTND